MTDNHDQIPAPRQRFNTFVEGREGVGLDAIYGVIVIPKVV